MKPLVRVLLKVGFTALVVGLMVMLVGWGEIAAALTRASLPWLVAMYALKLLRQVVDAFQFRFLTRRVGLDLALGRIFLASQLASLYSFVAPGEVAASAAKWANLSIATGARSAVLNVMVYMKLLYLAVPALIGAIALAIDNPFDSWWAPTLAWSLIAAIVLVMIALYHPALERTVNRWGRRLARFLPTSLEMKAGHLLNSMARVRKIGGRTHVTLIGLMCLGVAVEIGRFYSGIRALGLSVPLTSVLWVLAFMGVARLLPITVANLGIREGVLVFALAPLGVAAEQAVALGFLSFSAVVFLALIGAGYQLALATGLASARVGSSSDAPASIVWQGQGRPP